MPFQTSFSRVASAMFVALCLIATPAAAQGVTDYLGVPGPIALGGKDYVLSWSSKPSAAYTKQEYIPAGQKSETYQNMVMVEFLAANVSPMEMATTQANMLTERKKTDPLVNMDIIQNDATGEVILDFILSTKDTNGEYIVEWNAYRYARAKTSKGESGGMLFAVSHRAYGNEASKEFLSKLRDFKGPQIAALAGAPLPEL